MGKRLTNDWPHYKDRVTVADVLESGACLSGVIGFIEKHRGVIAGETRKFPNNEFIQQAANALSITAVFGGGYGDSGYGNGDGGGYGGGSGCYGGYGGYGDSCYGDGSDGNGSGGYGDSGYGGKL